MGLITTVRNLYLRTFRDAIRDASPRWLKRGLAEKLLYSMGIQFDAVADGALNGLRKRFPLMADSVDALGLVGKDRKISRGPAEGDEPYALRMLLWLDQHRTRGGPYALLEQLSAYWAATPFDIELVYENGKHYHMPAGGAITEGTGGPWDPNTSRWARWWLVFAWPGTVTDDGIWSDPGTWDDGGTWDTSLTESDVAALRQVPREWNAAHAQGHVVLTTGGIGVWDTPLDTWADGGTWEATGAGMRLEIKV